MRPQDGARAAVGDGEVVLAGVRAEFRTALRQEVEAARRNASGNGVGLVNGRRLAQVGGSYQYTFSIENALNAPSDTPGELRVPGHAPMEVAVLSIEGLSVTLSVPTDLGQFVPAAYLVTDLTFLLVKLIGRIEAMGEAPNPAGERIRGAQPASGRPLEMEPLPDLNPEQQEAVASALGRDTTFVWGPPGTGKTKTIGTIGRELYRRGRSLLLVSHTNTAVDQALLHIGAAVDPSELVLGRIVRVGEPKDQRLLAGENRELLLDTHVERRSAELAQRKDAALGEREVLVPEVLRLHRLTDVLEWTTTAADDIGTMAAQLADLQEVERKAQEAREWQEQAAASSAWWTAAERAASDAARDLAAGYELERQAKEQEDALVLLSQRLDERNTSFVEASRLLARAQEVEPLRARLRSLPSIQTQVRQVDDARARMAATEVRASDARARLSQAEAVLQEAAARGRLARAWRRLPDPDMQREVVEHHRVELSQATAEAETARVSTQHAESILEEVRRLADELRPHAGVPELEYQRHVVRDLTGALAEARAEVARCRSEVETARTRAEELAERVQAFQQEYGGTPAEMLERAASHAATLRESSALADSLHATAVRDRAGLDERSGHCLAALKGWFSVPETDGTVEAVLRAVQGIHTKALCEVEGMSLDGLRAQNDTLNERIRAIDADVAGIDEALKRVEQDIIAEALVVATTLTRAYLRDSIQSRRFDTVVLDEASIAPVPALWVAASLADAGVVAVGDRKQLPPIVQSKHPAAMKWLGKDIFRHARVGESASGVEHIVRLRRQYRMHPDISIVPNSLIYGGMLEDMPESLADGSLKDWYGGHDDAVLLVDMGPVGAWVTSVPRGESASRLNFLSATVCVDLAEQFLHNARPPKREGDGHRILIVCPYRAHASLLQLLVREQGLDTEVLPGTAHHFQGSEASVVILDLVNDEPHWRVKLFAPGSDEETRPLLNVALTRAQRRLVIVGDFDYIRKSGGKAFLGGELLPFLERRGYRRVSALDVVPTGLAGRAARAQAASIGGAVEPSSARQVVDQTGFYQLLANDLSAARSRVVIYSAFMTQQRLAMMEPHLRAAGERGVRVYVVTKDLGERRSQSRDYRYLEQTLRAWGVTIVHKRGMHEKLVFVDDRIVWTGSLNPLSFSNTQEVMERRESREVVDHYARIVRLGELLRRYVDGTPTCPSGHELFAAEGLREPFYWRCAEDGCFTCDMDEDFGRDGVILCSHPGCGAPLAYGEWGGRPTWRCTLNPRHHRKLLPFHLRFPKMRELIPSRDLRRLDREFGIRLDGPREGTPNQPRLRLDGDDSER